jgi:amino acid adenylation domain-containing protein/non-ribosomal peptide synthase protein (TIGR01720 family)
MSSLHERILALPPDKRAQLERRLQEGAPRRTAVAPIPRRANPAEPCEVSFAQRRIWFMHQVRPPFTPPSIVDLEGDLDLTALRAAFTGIVERHEALRTVIEVLDGRPVQRVLAPAPVPLPLHDLRHLPDIQQDHEVAQAVEEETYRPFDLGHDLMLRARIFRLAEQRYLLLLTTHHLAMDAWSFGILVRELGVLYEAAVAKRAPALPDLPIQYADFAVWQQEWLRGARLEQHLAYWRQHLGADPPRLELPADRVRPEGQAHAGASYDLPLSPELARQVKLLADRENATIFMTMLAAVAALLHGCTGQRELVLGSTIANRTRPETEGLIANFVNTLALRTNVSGDPTFRELLGRVRRTTLGALEHQELPFEKLVQELQPERDASQAPIVQMVVNYDNTPQFRLDNAGLRLHLRPVHMDVVHFDLTLTVTPSGDGMVSIWEYNTEVFESETIHRLAARWQSVLRQAVADPDLRIGDLELLTEADRRDLAAWNATATDVPETTVHQLFERQVGRTPAADAVTLGGATLSYTDLNARANRLAHHLRGLGVTRGALVGICVDRSLELPVGILAVLKAGGAYVPLDPNYPPARLADLLEDAVPQVLLTQQHLLGRLPRYRGQIIAVDAEWARIAEQPGTDPEPLATADDPAYVIYTSGSTGRPKGVLVQHRSLVGYATAAVDAFDLVPADRMLQFASLGFDVLVEELFPTWLAGATVVMVPERVLGGGEELLRLIHDERLTVFELPTSFWHEWVQALTHTGAILPGYLRLVIVGGERVLPDRLRAWQRIGVPLTHVFGLTETTVTTTTFRVPADARPDLWQNLPVGRPLANMTVHVLDERMRPVPVGVRGELYIGGIGVACGYLNRPELTAQRFVTDPFRPGTGAGLYRTGDLVRLRHSGDLEFIGRIDSQVKIRGHRIEPAEVEAALGRHPDLRELVVVAREDTPGDRRLVAYVVPMNGCRPDAGQLRRFLEPVLPAPLIPSIFVTLDALPTTPHGKLDRAALPAPDGNRPQLTEEFVAPTDPAEVILAQIWAEVIGVDRVGIHDNFFEIGGDSILSIQIVTRAQAAGLGLTPMDIFQYPTVQQLASHAQPASGGEARQQGPVAGPFPLVPLQRWFFDQRLPVPQHWNMSSVLKVREAYDDTLLREALDLLLRHHDGLRQRFDRAADGTVAGWVAEPGQPFPLQVYDLSAVPDAERAARFETLATGVQSSLDLRDGPLARAALVRYGGTEPDRLLVTAHHLAVDAVSWRIMMADFVLICEALRRGEPPVLPAKTTSFLEWASWLRRYAESADLTAQTDHWRAVHEAQAAPLPVDFSGAREHNTVGDSDLISVTLGPDLTDALLHTVASAYHTRINDLLLAALGLALCRWSGSPVHLVELEGHGRQDAGNEVDLSRTVGWFTAVYPVPLDATGTDPAEVIKRTKEHLRSVPAGGIGYLALRQSGVLPPPPVEPEIAFSYFGQLDQLLRADGPFAPAPERPGRTEDPAGPRPHLLEIAGEIRDGRLHLGCRYGRRVHRRERVQELLDTYLGELSALIGHCRGVTGAGFTPSDFPNARLSQSALDSFLARLTVEPGERQ